MADFTHLHLHTQYSFLDGAIHMKDLIPRIAELGMDACAVTEHGNLFGAIDFYRRAKGAGVKPILGFEAWVAEERERRVLIRATCHAGETLTADARGLFVRVDFDEVRQRMADRRAP